MKTFTKGDRVRFPQSFWVPSYRGEVGIVYSTSFTPAGAATCYVRLIDGSGRGAWELMADLESAPEVKP